MKTHVFRIGVKNFPAAHGGVETCTQNFVEATKGEYDFTIFTVWDNLKVLDNEIEGVKVFKLAKGWSGRFLQIRKAVCDKRNTVLDFQMEVFVPLAIVFSLLGYNVVSTIHGRSWWNVKISWPIRWLISIVDILGANLVCKTIYVSRWDYDHMLKYSFRRIYHIPNGSASCGEINHNPHKDMIFIGRISVQKNILALIEAADKYRRSLDIYGPFDEREGKYVEKVRQALNKSQYVQYCGVLSHEEIYPTLARYKYAVNASASEASPCSVIEAGACGLFLYLSKIPGHTAVGYPDVWYFDPTCIEFPAPKREYGRSVRNIAHHAKNLSLDAQVARYREIYGKF